MKTVAWGEVHLRADLAGMGLYLPIAQLQGNPSLDE